MRTLCVSLGHCSRGYGENFRQDIFRYGSLLLPLACQTHTLLGTVVPTLVWDGTRAVTVGPRRGWLDVRLRRKKETFIGSSELFTLSGAVLITVRIYRPEIYETKERG